RTADLLVALDRRARARRELEHEDFLALLGMLGEKALIAGEPLFQALGLVEPVDADDHVAADRAVAHPPPREARRRAVRSGGELARVDPDRRDDEPQPARPEPQLAGRLLDRAQVLHGIVAGR